MRDERGTLDYQSRPYRPTWRQRRQRAWRWLANLTFAGGVPLLPFLFIAVAVVSLLLFVDSFRDGPYWLMIMTLVPALGAFGFMLCFGVATIVLVDEANGWSRRWRDHRELRRLRQRTSTPWFATWRPRGPRRRMASSHQSPTTPRWIPRPSNR